MVVNSLVSHLKWLHLNNKVEHFSDKGGVVHVGIVLTCIEMFKGELNSTKDKWLRVISNMVLFKIVMCHNYESVVLFKIVICHNYESVASVV